MVFDAVLEHCADPPGSRTLRARGGPRRVLYGVRFQSRQANYLKHSKILYELPKTLEIHYGVRATYVLKAL